MGFRRGTPTRGSRLDERRLESDEFDLQLGGGARTHLVEVGVGRALTAARDSARTVGCIGVGNQVNDLLDLLGDSCP